MDKMIYTYGQKAKNKRVNLIYNQSDNTFVLQFKRLLGDSKIDNTTENTTARVEVLRNKVVVTSILVTYDSFMALMNSGFAFLQDLNKGKF